MRAGFAVVLVVLAGGCSWIAPNPDRPPAADMLDPEAIVSRCAERYARAKSLEIRGRIDDARRSPARRHSFRLVLARPDRCRFELDRDVVVVVGRDVWTYAAAADRFSKYRAFNSTPARTAADLATDGVSLLTIDLFEHGRQALDVPGGTAQRLRLEGMDYADRRPCFVIAEEFGSASGRLRLWIDQDRGELRRWCLYRRTVSGDDHPIVQVDQPEVSFDRAVDPATFRIGRTAAPP